MAGEITHVWHGTVLTITSDSGTSSMDLKGGTGNTGCRGPQGPAGIIVNADGTIDWNGYATEEWVNSQIDNINVDLTGIATEEFVNASIAEVQGIAAQYTRKLVSEAQIPDADVDLDDYALKVDLNNYVLKSDLNDYAPRTEVQTMINNALAALVDGEGVEY